MYFALSFPVLELCPLCPDSLPSAWILYETQEGREDERKQEGRGKEEGDLRRKKANSLFNLKSRISA